MVYQSKILLIFLFHFCKIQVVDSLNFKLYVRDQCTGRIEQSHLFYLKKGKKVFKINPKTGECHLPSNGIYKLCYLDSFPLTYSYHGQLADTLNISSLIFGFPTTPDSRQKPAYVLCNSKNADGKITDYYKKDIKRVNGKFKDGKLISNLIYYDLTGKIIKVEKPE
jgi:hypothetical protein